MRQDYQKDCTPVIKSNAKLFIGVEKSKKILVKLLASTIIKNVIISKTILSLKQKTSFSFEDLYVDDN